jgi:lysophospholipase L1-like esterase
MISLRHAAAIAAVCIGLFCGSGSSTAPSPPSGTDPAAAPPVSGALSKLPLSLREGERILFVGDALMHGEMDFGRIESHLQVRFPGRRLLCRNFSWKEDGLLSASGADRIDHLKARIAAFKPGLAIVGYGLGDLLNRKADPDAFQREVSSIIDAVLEGGKGTQPRWALIGPVPRETNGLADTNAARQNIQLKLYESRLRDLAARRDGVFVPLFDKFVQPALATRGITPLTRDSIHPNGYGYARIAEAVEIAFNWKPNMWRIGFNGEGGLREDNWGATITDIELGPARACWTALFDCLPNPVVMGRTRPMAMLSPPCRITIPSLSPGDYVLKIDGAPAATNSHRAWAAGEIIFRGAPFERAESLRLAIIGRNRAWVLEARGSEPESPAGAGFGGEGVAALDLKIQSLGAPARHRFEVKPLD